MGCTFDFLEKGFFPEHPVAYICLQASFIKNYLWLSENGNNEYLSGSTYLSKTGFPLTILWGWPGIFCIAIKVWHLLGNKLTNHGDKLLWNYDNLAPVWYKVMMNNDLVLWIVLWFNMEFLSEQTNGKRWPFDRNPDGRSTCDTVFKVDNLKWPWVQGPHTHDTKHMELCALLGVLIEIYRKKSQYI